MKQLIIGIALTLAGLGWVFYCDWRLGIGITLLWWGTLITDSVKENDNG